MVSDRSRNLGLKAFATSVIIFLWLPLLLMAGLSFGSSPYSSLPFGEFTLQWFEEALSEPDLVNAVTNTLYVSGATAFFATALGFFGATALVRYDFKHQNLFQLLVIVPLIIPGLIIGVALLTLFNSTIPWILSLQAVIIAHVVYTLPFALLTISARLYSFNQGMEEAARDLGASRFTVFKSITFPQLLPAFIAGALFVFVRSFSEFIRAFFVIGNQAVFTTELWSLVNFRVTRAINAISTIVMFGLIALLLIVYIFGSKEVWKSLRR